MLDMSRLDVVSAEGSAELLEGFDLKAAAFEDWLRAARHRETEARAATAHQEAAAALEANDLETALEAARTALKLDPYSEPALRLVMQTEAAADNRAGALDSYARFKTRLFNDLSAGPGEETRALAELIRSGQALRVSPGEAKGRSRAPVLAVLAFTDLAGGGTDMFADGVVEEITGALSRVHEFDVIARQSAFALRDERLDVQEAAGRLGADYLVEGTVQRAGERVRISVQLVRGSDGHTLWSERFDDRFDDLFDLQDRITAQVAGQLSPSLRTAEIARAGTRPPADRTAYELVLTALPHFWAHRKEDNARAIELLSAALARDPKYGPALAYKAWALAQQPVYMWSDDPQADHAAAARAINVAAMHVGDHAPSLVAVGAALALSSGDIPASRSAIDRALKLDPNNAWGWMRSGWTRTYEGEHETALVEFQRAEALSPLDPFRFNILLGRAVCHRRQGEFDRSVALIREGMRANPGITWAYRMLVGDLILAGRDDEAREAIATFRRHYPHATLSYLRACWPPAMTAHNHGYHEAFVRAGLPEN